MILINNLHTDHLFVFLSIFKLEWFNVLWWSVICRARLYRLLLRKNTESKIFTGLLCAVGVLLFVCETIYIKEFVETKYSNPSYEWKKKPQKHQNIFYSHHIDEDCAFKYNGILSRNWLKVVCTYQNYVGLFSPLK
jgi:hypothetical protein